MQNDHEKAEERINEFKKFIPYKISEVLRMKFTKDPFLVDKLIPEKGITIISGQPGCGKSWVALHIIQCIASKKDVFDKFKTKKVRILLIDGDTYFGEIARRIKLMKFRANREIYIISEKDIKIDRPGDLDKIIKLTKEKDIKFIVFDPFIYFHNKDENISGEMNKVMESVKEITRAGVTVLIIHHHRKESEKNSFHAAQNLRGSSAILGAVDSQIEVKADRNSPKEIMAISQNKARRSRAVPTFKIKMVEKNNFIYFDYIGESFENLSQREKVKAYILERLTAEKEVDFIALSKNKLAGESVFRDILKTMERDGIIKSRKAGHGKTFYSKAETPAF